MSPSSRRVALALAAAVAFAIVGAAALIGMLGGNWLAFLALAVLLCVTCLATFVMLASWTAISADLAEDRTPPRPRDQDTSQGLERLIVDGRVWDPDVTEVLERHGDRERWAS